MRILSTLNKIIVLASPLYTSSLLSKGLSSSSLLLSVSSSSSLYSTSLRMSYQNKQTESDVADVYIVPMFNDNYGYIIVDRDTGSAAAVDPGEPRAIMNAAQTLGLNLQQLWITHKHADHSGGNEFIKSKVPGLKIYGTKHESIPAITDGLGEGDSLQLGSLKVKVLYTPCHTSGHISFFVESPSSSIAPILFPGDTLFVGGCGRFFEGTADQMCDNMSRFSKLPSITKVYPAHEYTLSNYKFLASISKEICQKKYEEIQKVRDAGQSTVPSTIGDEIETNLFMKVFESQVQKLVGQDTPSTAMAELRQRKNNF